MGNDDYEYLDALDLVLENHVFSPAAQGVGRQVQGQGLDSLTERQTLVFQWEIAHRVAHEMRKKEIRRRIDGMPD